jgi:hypothetical protein
MYKSSYPVHKEFLGLLPKGCNTASCTLLSDVNVRPLRASFNGPKTWKSHGDKLLHSVTVKRFKSCVPSKRIDVLINWPTASHCCKISAVPMWPAEFRTNWMPCDGGCPDIPHTARMRFSRLRIIKESRQRPYVHVGRQCAGGCGTVV